ncbi:hypothetical protein C8R42DRAFT_722057 [Lentinula raphanica]|nr:hypothetical protein C8R42DRAFT_722057 [Lentinula raphanica]
MAGTPTTHPVSPTFVKLLEGTATIIQSSHVSTSSTSTDYHSMFQAFVDFFDRPIAVARSSSTTGSISKSIASSLSGSLMDDLNPHSLTMTPTAHSVSPSFVELLKGSATIIPSSHVSTSSSSTDYHSIFQAFVDFFDGPIAVARSSSTPASSSKSLASSLSGSLMDDLSTHSLTMTPTAHSVSPSFVELLEGSATIIPSSHVSTSSSSTDYHSMFQAFVDFFDGPIAVARSSSTPASSSKSPASSLSGGLMDDPASDPSLTMKSPVSIAPRALDDSLMNFNFSLIMLVITVSTVVLFIWPALRAKRLQGARMVLEHKGAHARVLQAREELSEETEETVEHEFDTALVK